MSSSYLLYSAVFLIFLLWPRVSHAKTCDSCSAISFNVNDGFKDRSLEDERLVGKDTIVESDPECFFQCYHDYRCLSFNVCGKSCQLNRANRYLVRNALRIKAGCRYYDLPLLEITCENRFSVLSGICSGHLSPCFNGGSCHVNISDTTRRFRCKCPSGFYGDQCQIAKPKACLDYWTGPIKPISRDYTIEDQAGNSYQVFCDFDSEEGIAWTMIESFSMKNEADLLAYPFTVDHPLNENNLNWDLFRLPKTSMVDITSRSIFWRATCSYPTYGVDYKDYLRVRLSQLDLTVFVGKVTFNSDACIQVDFLDIKGASCVNCTTAIFQLTNEMLHLNPFYSRFHHGCSFDSINIEHRCNNNDYARLLGVYRSCSDPSHRCSTQSSSTTQFWLGASKS